MSNQQFQCTEGKLSMHGIHFGSLYIPAILGPIQRQSMNSMYLFILGKGGATNPKVMVTFCTRHFLSSRGYNWENGVQNKKHTIHYSETLQNQLHLTQTVVLSDTETIHGKSW